MADMAAVKVLFATLVCLLLVTGFTNGLSEQGIFKYDARERNITAITKAMYNNSVVSLSITCSKNVQLNVRWLLRLSPCAGEYIAIEQEPRVINIYLNAPRLVPVSMDVKYKKVKFLSSRLHTIDCGQDKFATQHLEQYLKASDWKKEDAIYQDKEVSPSASSKGDKATDKPEKDKKSEKPDQPKSRKKRADDAAKAPSTTTITATKPPKESSSTTPRPDQGNLQKVATIPEEGIYLFVLEILPIGDVEKDLKIEVTVDMKGPHGYLSATEWPLLPFYAVMCVVYLIFGLAWLIMLGCNWRDLLRIQFWIGGVILLGMLEKAVFLAEYESVNTTGVSVRGALIFAELVSSFKRALARMLVVIVSVGFGIVKPRLGPTLPKVMGMGLLYFILGSVEGCMRVLKHKADTSKQQLIANIPLAVLDAAICWWIFTSLVQTTRTLRLRRNVVKLTLYRHFTNTLIFCILASVAYMIWSIKQHRLTTCLSDWKELWIDEAFWHLLFSIILLVIMVLWRPSVNNQRYAAAPLLDPDEEDVDEPTMNDAFDGMKLRGKNLNGMNPVKYDPKDKAEDDLKWVDEHIPASVADTALPSLLDSDEEIMTTKFEQSKME